jgi:hypothetical protein
LQLQAVVFFDRGQDDWRVRDRRGREWGLSSSPIRERDALVFFDDSHCRGADMKLRPNAKGLVTLGTRMPKDKLMQVRAAAVRSECRFCNVTTYNSLHGTIKDQGIQLAMLRCRSWLSQAAGRMRQLDKGQSLRFLATRDVELQVRRANLATHEGDLSSTHVLQWAMSNTVTASLEGLAEFAKQGLLFAHTHLGGSRLLLNEVLTLHEFYSTVLAEQSLPDRFTKLTQDWRKLRQEVRAPSMSPEMEGLVQALKGHVEGYGGDHSVRATGLDEECERELEREEEKEVEREVQVR